MTTPLDDEFTELRDADIPRVDLVDKAANGMKFLLAKREDGAGLMDPDLIRDLIGKAEPDPPADSRETVTMTGTPGAIFKFIHEAAQRATEPVAKAKYDADDLKRMAANGEAMENESYPIADRDDLDNAIHAVGRGGADHNAIRRHVIDRAKALGASSEIPDNWNADGSLKGSVAKELNMNLDDDALDVTEALAEPEIDAPGLPTDPGSPAWEAIDAATACKWTAILARAKNAVCLLSERELLEAAAGDEDDACQAMDLQDACSAIDYAISVLAPFAVAEHAEAAAGDEMAAVGKALATFDAAPLDTIEALASITKAGRVLSASNEAAIRGAVESLQKVLASLPAAPETEAGQPVTKSEETDMPEPTPADEVETEAGEKPEMGVAKADGEKTPMVAVYDAKGKLVGIVDPGEITPISGADAGDESDGDDTDDSDDDTDKDVPPTGGDDTDLTPAPAGEVGTPADAVPDDEAVSKSTTDNTASVDVLKSIAADVAKTVLDTYSATQAEQIAKTGDAVLELAEMVETLKGRVVALEEQPAEPKVFTNGAVPPREMLRGQDRGALAAIDVAKAQEMKKGLYGAADATEQKRIADDMQTLAIARLQEIRQRH